MQTTTTAELSNEEQLQEAENTARQLIARAPNSCRAYEALAIALERQNKKEEALQAFRHAFSLGTKANSYRDQVEQIIYDTHGRAELVDFGISMDARILPPTIFIASIPSDFSQIIAQILSRVLDYKQVHLSQGSYQNEQNLDIVQMAHKLQAPNIINQAVRATECNLHRIQAYQLNPVVYLENIYDLLIDLRDKFRENNELAIISPNYNHLPPQTQLKTIIDTWGFWYIEFYASWVLAKNNKRCPVLFLSKEELITDSYEQLKNIITHSKAGLNHNNADDMLQNEVYEIEINSAYEQKVSRERIHR